MRFHAASDPCTNITNIDTYYIGSLIYNYLTKITNNL